MNLLAIDTSTERASLALAVNDKVYSEEQGAQRQHAQLLLPMIERLLYQASLSMSQLDGIVFGCGPGSFTGLRIACSIAKGMGYANDLPLYPVTSLAAIAAEVLEQTKLDNVAILALIDARMNQLYWGCFVDGVIEGDEKVSAAMELQVFTERPLLVAGVGYEPYQHQLPASLRAKIIDYKNCYPSAQTMLRLVRQGQIKAVSAAEASPVYVRNQITQGELNG